MLRRILWTLFAVLASCSHGALDFQFQRRFHPFVLRSEPLTKIAKHGDGCYFVVGGDICILRFGADDQLRGSIYWTPRSRSTSVFGAATTPDGGLIVRTLGSVAQFSKFLQKQWEVDLGAGLGTFAVSGDGHTFAVDEEGQLTIISPVGQVVNRQMLAGITLRFMVPDPDDPRAVWIQCQVSDNRAAFVKLDTNLNQLSRFELPEANTLISDITYDANGIVAVGKSFEAGSQPFLATITGAGTFKSIPLDYPTYRNCRVTNNDVFLWTGVDELHRRSRVDGMLKAVYSRSRGQFADSILSNELVAIHDSILYVYDRETGIEKSRMPFTGSAIAAATLGGKAAFVGHLDGQGTIWRNQAGVSVESYGAMGPDERLVRSSVVTPDGGISVVAHQRTSQDLCVLRYNRFGQLLNAESVEGHDGKCVVASSDGSTYLASQTGATVQLSRFAQDGSLDWTKSLPPGSNQAQDAKSLLALSDGGCLVTVACPNGLRVMKFDQGGNIRFWRELAGYTDSMARLALLSRGRVAVYLVGPSQPHLLVFSEYTGELIQNFQVGTNFHSALDMAIDARGNILLSDGVSFQRRSSIDPSLVLGTGRFPFPFPVSVIPTGDGGIATLTGETSNYWLRFYDGEAKLRTETLVTPFAAGEAFLTQGPGSTVYVLWRDRPALYGEEEWLAIGKFLPTGGRSSYSRLMGYPRGLHGDSNGLWIVSQTEQRGKGSNPQIARFTH